MDGQRSACDRRLRLHLLPRSCGRATGAKPWLEFLRERREVLYDNLRDLNFEYRAGKYPEEDYVAQRASLENEAAVVVAEIGDLEGAKSL